MPEKKQNPFFNINKLVHEPARLMILSFLYVVESVDYVFLVQHTGLTWGNLSAHINKLEAEGYIDIKKEFIHKKPNSLVSITKLGRDEFDKYRKHMKGIFDDFPD